MPDRSVKTSENGDLKQDQVLEGAVSKANTPPPSQALPARNGARYSARIGHAVRRTQGGKGGKRRGAHRGIYSALHPRIYPCGLNRATANRVGTEIIVSLARRLEARNRDKVNLRRQGARSQRSV